MPGEYKDGGLAARGMRRIAWADRGMPVLRSIRQAWASEKPLQGVRVAACLHVTTETANLVRTLVAGGAEVALCASNPLSTQDDVAAALSKEFGIPTFAIRGEAHDTYYHHIHRVLDLKPHITLDDGADLVNTLHAERDELLGDILAGTEETTTGVVRLKAMEANGALKMPIIAVNDAMTKHMFDNRYGTGQSTLDGIVRATNHLLAGSRFVVVGYGWCGRGLAMRARGMGAHVHVVESDPLRALEAVMDGYPVTSMNEASCIGDIFVTVTGNKHAIDVQHFEKMQDGAIVANAGHFDVELNVFGLRALAGGKTSEVREGVEEFILPSGRRIYLLSQGRLVNLAAAEGHPPQVMDMSFANQALSVKFLTDKAGQMQNKVYSVPLEIDRKIAEMKLESMGYAAERLSDEQMKYLTRFDVGT